jgi:hypothetical protein
MMECNHDLRPVVVDLTCSSSEEDSSIDSYYDLFVKQKFITIDGDDDDDEDATTNDKTKTTTNLLSQNFQVRFFTL